MFYCEQSPVKLKGGGGEEKPDAAWNELSATRRKLGNLMEGYSGGEGGSGFQKTATA